MSYKTLLVSELQGCLTVTIHRSSNRNSINGELLAELHMVLDQAEANPSLRIIFLQGENGLFCTGMDFQDVARNIADIKQDAMFSASYMALLKRFATSSKIVIALVDGQVLAGGVGFVAASDMVISTIRTQFALSEALWGLLPACVTPFLIRRIGFQKAYYMTLSCQPVTAQKALDIGLVDELTDNLDDSIRRVKLRLMRVQETTVSDLKNYFRQMWIITEAMESKAIAEITRLINKPEVRVNIKQYIEQQRFPWEEVVEE
jgi:polyketide biosynthesis enoyl-CoA hydratase PksH